MVGSSNWETPTGSIFLSHEMTAFALCSGERGLSIDSLAATESPDSGSVLIDEEESDVSLKAARVFFGYTNGKAGYLANLPVRGYS